MTTHYVILRATDNNYGGEDHPEFYVLTDVSASNAEQACRRGVR